MVKGASCHGTARCYAIRLLYLVDTVDIKRTVLIFSAPSTSCEKSF